jgi:hypothetical protein
LRAEGIPKLALTDPCALGSEQVGAALHILTARALAEELGHPVAPHQVRFMIQKRENVTTAEVRAQLLQELEELCGDFPMERAIYIIASLFPAFREWYDAMEQIPLFKDSDRLRDIAVSMLDDEFWHESEQIITE